MLDSALIDTKENITQQTKKCFRKKICIQSFLFLFVYYSLDKTEGWKKNSFKKKKKKLLLGVLKYVHSEF